MDSETKKMVDKVLLDADKAAREWLREQAPNVKDNVLRILDQRQTEIVAKLMGFSSSWGKWEVDHCNGRSGESAAGDWLKSQAGEAVNAWLTAQAGKLPKLPEKAISSLRNEYKKTLEYELRQRLRERAILDAKDIAQKVFTNANN